MNCIGKQAFQFANRCMMLQRAQTKVALNIDHLDKRVKPVHNGKWRLFQIMFLINECIPGISDRNHKDREFVDLIWFPTGGGKTEAYLGVAAYLMAYRRLSADMFECRGICWSNRIYALYITFINHAAIPTCDSPNLCCRIYSTLNSLILYGTVPFSIGLWIGSDSSPNLLKEASEKLEEIHQGKRSAKRKSDAAYPLSMVRN